MICLHHFYHPSLQTNSSLSVISTENLFSFSSVDSDDWLLDLSYKFTHLSWQLKTGGSCCRWHWQHPKTRQDGQICCTGNIILSKRFYNFCTRYSNADWEGVALSPPSPPSLQLKNFNLASPPSSLQKKTSTVIHQPHSLPLISPAKRVHFTHPFPTPSILYGARISGNVAFYADALWTGHGGRLRDKHN